MTIELKANPLILIDMESTGLDPAKSLLLEISAVAVDPVDLRVLGRFSQVISGKPERGEAQRLHDLWEDTVIADVPEEDRFVVQTHGANGLLEDVLSLNGRVTTINIDNQINSWLDRMLKGVDPTLAGKPLWVGNSPLLDRQLIRRQLPTFYGRMSHRSIDMSSFREAHKLWSYVDSARSEMPNDTTDHRATTCAENTYNQLKFFRNYLWVMGGASVTKIYRATHPASAPIVNVGSQMDAPLEAVTSAPSSWQDVPKSFNAQ